MSNQLKLAKKLAFAIAALGLVGCAADLSGEADVQGAEQELRRQDGLLLDTVGALTGALGGETRDAVNAVEECTEHMAACTLEFGGVGDAVQCQEEYVECVTDTLGVPLPELPVASTVACAESAVACTLEAGSVRGVTDCANDLAQCALEDIEIIGVVGDTLQCTTDSAQCVLSSELPSEGVSCLEEELHCVSGLLGVELPDLPADDLVHCAEHAAECVLEFGGIGDTARCATELVACSAETIEVIETVEEVVECTDATADCVFSAESASGLAGCAEEQASCVFGTIGVPVPELPADELLSCAESTIACSMESRRLGDLLHCGTELPQCAIHEIAETPIVNCSSQFTKCLAANPLNLFGCAAEMTVCNFDQGEGSLL